MPDASPTIARVMQEQHQNHETRKPLFVDLGKELGRPVLSFFTSFVHPVMIDESDVDMIEGMLLKMDLSNGLALVISSPGGDGLSAERIVNLCRKYSGTGEYWAVVPSRAKSAATMICLGASRILMGPSSELGPIDPQLSFREGSMIKRFSVWNLVESYKDLFGRAVKEKGNLEPYIQQLGNYDEREIAEYKTAIELSEDIAIRSLASGMLTGKSKTYIRKKIEVFLTPQQTKAHGRAIYSTEAASCALNISVQDANTTAWQKCYELYIRTNNLVSTRVSKCIETEAHSFSARVPNHD